MSEIIIHQFHSATNCSASTMTVHQKLRAVGFHGEAAAHEPNISPLNTNWQLKWCKEQCYWTVDNWKHVIWGDESRYTMWQSDGRVWVWWMPGEQYLPACVVLTVIFWGGGITVWGVFHGIDLALSYYMEGCKDILMHCVLSMIEEQFGDDNCISIMLPAIKQGLWGNGLWTVSCRNGLPCPAQPRVLNWIP